MPIARVEVTLVSHALFVIASSELHLLPPFFFLVANVTWFLGRVRDFFSCRCALASCRRLTSRLLRGFLVLASASMSTSAVTALSLLESLGAMKGVSVLVSRGYLCCDTHRPPAQLPSFRPWAPLRVRAALQRVAHFAPARPDQIPASSAQHCSS